VAEDRGGLVFNFRRPTMQRLVIRADEVEARFWPMPERRLSRVVLDAGHGGKDPGAVGRVLGTHEKVLTLDICARLRRKLAAAGFEVVMSRDSDAYVPLAERSRVAGHGRADLFVSVHVNASPNRGACGLETYFLSEAKTDWERAVAARENAELDSSPGNGTYGPGDLGLILADLAQNEFLHESSELAADIQQECAAYARVKDRGVKQANFYVLRNTYMPAVLVECGFLSNKSEEKLLRKPAHREKLAEGVTRGITTFCRRFAANGGNGASRPPGGGG
jgi:N-acetylmuramoyl-L-alanine amidase